MRRPTFAPREWGGLRLSRQWYALLAMAASLVVLLVAWAWQTRFGVSHKR